MGVEHHSQQRRAGARQSGHEYRLGRSGGRRGARLRVTQPLSSAGVDHSVDKLDVAPDVIVRERRDGIAGSLIVREGLVPGFEILEFLADRVVQEDVLVRWQAAGMEHVDHPIDMRAIRRLAQF